MKKKFLIIFALYLLFQIKISSMDGLFLGFKTGLLLKIDVASAFISKRVIDQNKSMENSIPTGIGEYGMTDPHGFPRVLESKVAPYGDLIINWGYKFPKIFALGFGFLLSNLVMPSLMFDFKFSFREDKKLKPFVFLDIYSGLLDGFPIGITVGGGVDIYINNNFYFLIESKLGTEIFVSRYYDDGINSNPIWHWDTTYAYAVYALYIGFGYQFKNPFTDERGNLIKKNKKEN